MAIFQNHCWIFQRCGINQRDELRAGPSPLAHTEGQSPHAYTSTRPPRTDHPTLTHAAQVFLYAIFYFPRRLFRLWANPHTLRARGFRRWRRRCTKWHHFLLAIHHWSRALQARAFGAWSRGRIDTANQTSVELPAVDAQRPWRTRGIQLLNHHGVLEQRPMLPCSRQPLMGSQAAWMRRWLWRWYAHTGALVTPQEVNSMSGALPDSTETRWTPPHSSPLSRHSDPNDFSFPIVHEPLPTSAELVDPHQRWGDLSDRHYPADQPLYEPWQPEFQSSDQFEFESDDKFGSDEWGSLGTWTESAEFVPGLMPVVCSCAPAVWLPSKPSAHVMLQDSYCGAGMRAGLDSGCVHYIRAQSAVLSCRVLRARCVGR